MSVITITEQNFNEEVLQSDKPVLIDFWASWCNPCRMLSPTVDEIAEETDTIKVCKINVDEQPSLAERYQVMSIPTLIRIDSGNLTTQMVGVQPKKTIQEMMGI